jgi:hypothetical protein
VISLRRPDFQQNENTIESAAGIDKAVAVTFDDEKMKVKQKLNFVLTTK